MPANNRSAKANASARGREHRRERERRRRAKEGPVKPFKPSAAARVSPESIMFIPMRPGRKRGVRRVAWRVMHAGQRAGTVAILCHEENGAVVKPSIDVQLNKRSQGRGIGTLAFQRAAELSGFKQVFASIAKKNIASRIAAKRAGFVELAPEASGELVLVWRRVES